MIRTPINKRGAWLALGSELGALLEQNQADYPTARHVILNEPAFIPAVIELIEKISQNHGLSREDLGRLAQDCRKILSNDGISYCDATWRRLSSFIIDGRALSRPSTNDIKLIVAWYQTPNAINTSEVPLSVSMHTHETAETLYRDLHHRIRHGMFEAYLRAQDELAGKLENRSRIDTLDLPPELRHLLKTQGIYLLVELTGWTEQELLEIDGMTTERVDDIKHVLHDAGLSLAG